MMPQQADRARATAEPSAQLSRAPGQAQPDALLQDVKQLGPLASGHGQYIACNACKRWNAHSLYEIEIQLALLLRRLPGLSSCSMITTPFAERNIVHD